MPAWQQEEGEALLDRLLGPVGEPGIFGAPSGEPLGETGAGLGEVAPAVEPAQFLQAVVVGLPWQGIERVPQEVHVAALVCGAGQHLADPRAQAGMIVGDARSEERRVGKESGSECSRGWEPSHKKKKK